MLFEENTKFKSEHKYAKAEKIEQLDNWLICSACGSKLINAITVRNFDVSMKYKANCPYCGDHSRPVQTKGDIVFELPEGLSMNKFDIVGETVVIYLIKEKS